MDGPQERRDHEAVHQHVVADEAQDRDAHGPLEASQAQPQQAVQEATGEDQQLEETQQKKRKEHRSTIRGGPRHNAPESPIPTKDELKK